jgi:polysaccharide deacetylase family sporulation protein PdaB
MMKMNFFITLSGKRVKQGLFILMISFFTALFYFSQESVHIPVLSGKDGPKAIYKGDKGIALTFHIGWGDVQAEPILEVLEKEKAKSITFFLSGSWAERHPDMVEKIKKMGYEIGSLGYAYEDYTEIEEDKIRRDMNRSIEVLRKLDVKEIKLIRSPTGHFDKRSLKIAEELGLTMVHWSLNSQDWKNPGVEKIVQEVAKVQKGDIVLMHASDSATQTAKALPEVLSIIRQKGEMVTVSELIANGKVKTTIVP